MQEKFENEEERLNHLNYEVKKLPGDFNYIMGGFLKDYGEKFVTAPASTRFHHAYPGGLCDHSLEVLWGVRNMCEVFPELDREIIENGAILHDIGKIISYQLNNPTTRGTKIPAQKYQRTKDVVWVGDIGETLLLTNEYFNESISSPERFKEIQHIIASHHGDVRRGWGSLVDPKTIEAKVVHFVDMISSRVRTNTPKMDWASVFAEVYPDVFEVKEAAK